MKTDPKAGDVFDYVEPIEPKTKGLLYKFVEGMKSDDRSLLGVFISLSLMGAVIAISCAAVPIVEIIYSAPAVSLEKKEGGE